MTRRTALAALAGGSLMAQRFSGGVRTAGSLRGPGSAPLKFVPFIGQSNANGIDPVQTTTQPYGNKTWVGGNIASQWADFSNPVASIASMVPLIEGISYFFESPQSAFANQISAWARDAGYGSAWDQLVCSFAVGATGYSGLEKGTTPYAASIAAVTRHAVLSPGGSVPALICVHGENDGSCGYITLVNEWQADYETDIKAITGQSGTIPIFMTQVQAGECASGASDLGMLGAHEANPTKTILVGPKYVMPYQPEGTHLTPAGYIWLGELYAKAYWKHVVLGQQWQPLRPTSVTRSGAVITIQFTGHTGNLVFDTTTVPNPGNYGFEVAVNDSTTISNVAITNASAGIVQITLSSSSPSLDAHPVRYAYTGAPYGPLAGGARGCLRDSDTLVSRSGNALHNWCVHFAEACA